MDVELQIWYIDRMIADGPHRLIGKIRSTELLLPSNTCARALSFPSSSINPGLNSQKISLEEMEVATVSLYLDSVLALAWFLDHTILVVSKRKALTYLECVSKGRITQLIQLPALLDQVSIFDVVSTNVNCAYAFLSNGRFGCILRINALIETSFSGSVRRPVPSSYDISLLYTVDLNLIHPVLPFVNCKIIVSLSTLPVDGDQVALVTVDSRGAAHIHRDGGVHELGEHFEDVFRLETHLPNYDSFAVFKTLHLGDPYFEWSHSLSTPLALNAFERGHFFGFKEGVILWSSIKSIVHQVQRSDMSNFSKYLPFQFLDLSRISFPFCVYQQVVSGITVPDSFLSGALFMSYSHSASCGLMLDSIEVMLKQEVESKAFQHDSASFTNALQVLATHDPLLLSEVLSSLTRKLEPSVLQRIFPIQPGNASQVDLFSISLQNSILSHAARLLTVASEHIGKSDQVAVLHRGMTRNIFRWI